MASCLVGMAGFERRRVEALRLGMLSMMLLAQCLTTLLLPWLALKPSPLPELAAPGMRELGIFLFVLGAFAIVGHIWWVMRSGYRLGIRHEVPEDA